MEKSIRMFLVGVEPRLSALYLVLSSLSGCLRVTSVQMITSDIQARDCGAD
jgi:hypothetical protein